MKRWKKWLAMVVAFIIAMFMGSAISSTPISMRAIVVGLGIDAVEDEIEVTAQILITEGSTSGSTPKNKELSAKHKTVSGALALIAQNSSMQVSLAHCNLVVLGNELLKKDAFYPIDYLVRNAYLSENALLVGTDITAKEILSSKVAFSGGLSSFYAQSAVEALGDYDDMTQRTIKNFVQDDLRTNKSNYLMILERVPMEESAVHTASGDEAGGGSGDSKEQEYYFNMNKTAIFKESKIVEVLTEDETAGLNYVLNKVEKGAINTTGEDDRPIELYVVNSSVSTDYSDSGNLKVEVKINAVMKEINAKEGLIKRQQTTLTPVEKRRAEEYVEQSIMQCFEKCKSVGVDIYDFEGELFREYKIRDFSVENATVSPKVEIHVEG